MGKVGPSKNIKINKFTSFPPFQNRILNIEYLESRNPHFFQNKTIFLQAPFPDCLANDVEKYTVGKYLHPSLSRDEEIKVMPTYLWRS